MDKLEISPESVQALFRFIMDDNRLMDELTIKLYPLIRSVARADAKTQGGKVEDWPQLP